MLLFLICVVYVEVTFTAYPTSMLQNESFLVEWVADNPISYARLDLYNTSSFIKMLLETTEDVRFYNFSYVEGNYVMKLFVVQDVTNENNTYNIVDQIIMPPFEIIYIAPWLKTLPWWVILLCVLFNILGCIGVCIFHSCGCLGLTIYISSICGLPILGGCIEKGREIYEKRKEEHPKDEEQGGTNPTTPKK